MAGPVDHVDVVVVGAGLSGIGMARHLQASCPWATFTILESRDAIGGTWDLFRYPGIRSDSDMYTLGYPFRPWAGDTAIADGDAIRRYIVDTATETGVDRHIRFGHRVTGLSWSTDEARWTVTAERTDTAETVVMTCGFVASCTGYYRYARGYTPDFDGMDEFNGTIVHPQHWPDDLDVDGRQVVVIGSGATAITLVPALAPVAGHVTMVQRSPTWVVSLSRRDPLASRLQRMLPRRLADRVIRWTKVAASQGSYFLARRRPEVVKRGLRKGLERDLPPGYDIDTHFTPRYEPWDQRLCGAADGDLFAAIGSGRASVVTDTIDRFTPTGLALGSGEHLDADIVVTATGLEMLFLGGMAVTVDGEAVEPSERMLYKGALVERVPNLAIAFGYANASWTLKADLTSEFVCRLLNHLHGGAGSWCMPVNRGVPEAPGSILGLTSGYLMRAADRMPRQGAAFPWRVSQSYRRDRRALRAGGFDDESLVFGRAPAAMPSSTGAA